MGGDEFVYNSQLDAFSLYHIINEDQGPTSIGGGPALPALGHAIAGSAGSAVAKALTYPIDLVVTRLQVQKQLRGKGEAESAAKNADAEYTGLLDATSKIYKNEGGTNAFFTGCAPDIAKGVADSFLFFLLYTLLRNYQMRKRSAKHLGIAEDLAVGIGAGALSKFVTTPVQAIVTRQQTAALVAARDPSSTSADDKDRLSMRQIAAQIYEERGLRGFWAGYSASVVLTTNPAITFAVDNLLKRLLPKARQEKPGPYLTFLLAALSKAIATSITYPVQLAKTRAQVGGSSHDDDDDDDDDDDHHDNDAPLAGSTPVFLEKPNSKPTTHKRAKRQLKRTLQLLSGQYALFLSLRGIYRREGLQGLYSGLEGEVLKGFLSHGLTMMMKEKVHVGVIQIYYALLMLTRRWPEQVAKAKEGVVQAGQIVVDGTRKVAVTED